VFPKPWHFVISVVFALFNRLVMRFWAIIPACGSTYMPFSTCIITKPFTSTFSCSSYYLITSPGKLSSFMRMNSSQSIGVFR
jgi:hypothetical protein